MDPLQLISQALKVSGVLGVGQTALAEDVNDAFTFLNMMVALWNRKRWLIYHLVDISCVSTGSQTYSVGQNCDFNVARPDTLEYAYIRMINNNPNSSGFVDYPLQIIEAHESYAAITLKGLVSFPTSVFYDPTFPNGTLYVWPIPSHTYEIHIILKETLNQFPDLVTTINLPNEYQEALIWNLAVRLRPLYGLPPDPTITALAKVALSTVRGSNSEIPDLTLPGGLSRKSGGTRYNAGGVREGTFTLDKDILG